MIATVDMPQRPPLRGVAGRQLVLRVSGPSRGSQVVCLTSAKCTIGSAPSCTLRLRARGVAPFHCLIVRGPTATIVRRWSPDTRLNEHSFVDAPLLDGDRLTVGPVELEVIDVGTGGADVVLPETNDWSTEETGAAPEIMPSTLQSQLDALEEERQQWLDEKDRAQRELDRQHEELATKSAELDNLKAGISGDRATLESDLATLAEERRQWKEELRQWDVDKQQAESQIEQCRQQLEADSEQLEKRRRQLDCQETSFESGRQAWEEERRQQLALADQRDGLQGQADALAQERQQWLAEKEETQQQFEQQQAELAAESAALEARRNVIEQEHATLKQQRENFEQQRQEWQQRLEQQQAELDAKLTALQEQRDGVEQERAALEQQQDECEQERQNRQSEQSTNVAAAQESGSPSEPEELHFRAPSEKAPVDLADVFRRVGATVETSEEEPEPPHVSECGAGVEAAPAAVESEEGDESVDAYMSRLMQRIRSTEASAVSRMPPSSPSWGTDVDTETTAPPQPEPLPVAQRREPASVLPRATAPETHVDLSALREVANLSAQSNLSRHARQMLVNRMHSKLMLAVVALVTGGGLFLLWKRFAGWEASYYGALIALLAAVYFALHYALLTGRLIVNKSGHVAWNSQSGNPESSSLPEAETEDLVADPVGATIEGEGVRAEQGESAVDGKSPAADGDCDS